MNKLARNIRIAGKVFYFILIFLTIAIAMSGCEYFRMSIGKKPDDSVRIIYNVYSETFTDDSGVPILEANIVYPRIAQRRKLMRSMALTLSPRSDEGLPRHYND